MEFSRYAEWWHTIECHREDVRIHYMEKCTIKSSSTVVVIDNCLWWGISKSIAWKECPNSSTVTVALVHPRSNLWGFQTKDVNKILIDYGKLRKSPKSHVVVPTKPFHTLTNLIISPGMHLTAFRIIFITPKINIIIMFDQYSTFPRNERTVLRKQQQANKLPNEPETEHEQLW